MLKKLPSAGQKLYPASGLRGVVVVSPSVTSAPAGGEPVAVALFTTWPAVRSAGSTAYTLFVHVMDSVAPTARLPIAVQLRDGSSRSVTLTLVRTTLPVLCTLKL